MRTIDRTRLDGACPARRSALLLDRAGFDQDARPGLGTLSRRPVRPTAGTIGGGGAITKARPVAVRDHAIRLEPFPLKSDLAVHLTMLYEIRRRAPGRDILHFHVDLMCFRFFESIAHRTVATLRGRLDLKDLVEAYRRWPEYRLVPASDSQRLPLAEASRTATVHHGLLVDRYHFHALATGGYVAFLGRITPGKRTDRAFDIARRAGVLRTGRVDVGPSFHQRDRPPAEPAPVRKTESMPPSRPRRNARLAHRSLGPEPSHPLEIPLAGP